MQIVIRDKKINTIQIKSLAKEICQGRESVFLNLGTAGPLGESLPVFGGPIGEASSLME